MEEKTLRDEIAMAAMCEHIRFAYAYPNAIKKQADNKNVGASEMISMMSYELADAMLDQRTKQ